MKRLTPVRRREGRRDWSGRNGILRRVKGAFEYCGPAQVANTVLNMAERTLGHSRVRSLPLTVQVEVTSRCNLNCMICSRWCAPFRGEDLRSSLIDTVIEASARSRELVLFGYGEPLIAQPFFSLLERAKSGRLSFVTNGLTMGGELTEGILAAAKRPLYTIAFSIDGAHPETYHSIRERSDYHRVWANLAVLGEKTRGMRRPEVWIDFVAMKRNVAELPRLIEKAAEVGVKRVNVFNVVVWDESYSEESLLDETEGATAAFAEAKQTAARCGIIVDLPVVPQRRSNSAAASRPCFDPWSYAYIRQDGTVQACCFADEFAMGDLTKESFSTIWNNAAYRKLRASVNSDEPPGPCRRCEQRWRSVNSDDDSAVYLRLRPRTGNTVV